MSTIAKNTTKKKTALSGAMKNERKKSKKAQDIKNAFDKAREVSADLIKKGKFVPFSKNLIYGD